MIEQQGHAVWRGGLKDGSGSFSAGSLAGKYSFSSRFEGGAGSSPEELIGAAHASCFSMALSLFLGGHGHTRTRSKLPRRFIWTHNGSS